MNRALTTLLATTAALTTATSAWAWNPTVVSFSCPQVDLLLPQEASPWGLFVYQDDDATPVFKGTTSASGPYFFSWSATDNAEHKFRLVVGDAGNPTDGTTVAATGQNCAGKTGPAGHPGPTGAPGAPGVNGSSGPAGAKGDTGAPGAPGAAGVGTPGVAGKNGAAGVRGARGQQGKPGAAGRNGAPGLRGPAGVNGKQGAPGRNGKAGKTTMLTKVVKVTAPPTCIRTPNGGCGFEARG